MSSGPFYVSPSLCQRKKRALHNWYSWTNALSRTFFPYPKSIQALWQTDTLLNTNFALGPQPTRYTHADKSWQNCSAGIILQHPVPPQYSQRLITTKDEGFHGQHQGEGSRCFPLITRNVVNVMMAWHHVPPHHASPHSSRCGSACREASTAVSVAISQFRGFWSGRKNNRLVHTLHNSHNSGKAKHLCWCSSKC